MTGGGKGENSQAQHEEPPELHSSDDREHHGEYHEVLAPHDREQAADMDLALVIFRSLTILTAAAAIFCGIVNLVSLIKSFRWHLDVFFAILRIYAIIFAIFIAVAETEWEWLLRHWPYLQYWFFRGNLQIFVAVLTRSLSGLTYEPRFEIVIHDVAAYILLGCGFVYSVAGILCMRKLKHRRIEKKQWRDQAVKDLEELNKKRRRLQGLLAEGA